MATPALSEIEREFARLSPKAQLSLLERLVYPHERVRQRLRSALSVSILGIALLSAEFALAAETKEGNAGMPIPASLVNESVSDLERRATRGEVEAEYELGVRYFLGAGVKKDTVKAYEYYERVAGRGHSHAKLQCGECLRSGTGVERNILRALKEYGEAWTAMSTDDRAKYGKSAALGSRDSGDPKAKREVGFLYLAGYAVKKNPGSAETLLREAAVAGDGGAYLLLGDMYLNGIGVKSNATKAVDFYQHGWKLGEPLALYELARLQLRGEGTEANQELALKNLRVAAAHEIDAPRLLLERIGREVQSTSTNKSDAALSLSASSDEVQRAALRRDAVAQYKMGLAYVQGLTVQKSQTAALEWFTKAAKQGHVPSQSWAGDLNLSGTDGGVPRLEQAAHWYSLASSNGHAQASHNLSMLYASGRGVGKDEARAVELLQTAAAQGLPESQFTLGELYRTGSMVSKNMKKAIEWYHKAATGGDYNAMERLGVTYWNGEEAGRDQDEGLKYLIAAALGGN